MRDTIRTYKRMILDDVASVTDLACGDDPSNKIFFDNDVPVLGVDIYENDIEHDMFTFKKEDIRDFKMTDSDVIICNLALHFFYKGMSHEIIKDMKKHAKYNIISVLGAGDSFAKGNEDSFHPTEDEIKEIYKDWNIIDIETHTITETHPIDESGIPKEHTHSIITLLAKKI
jgi:hypothetical protein